MSADAGELAERALAIAGDEQVQVTVRGTDSRRVDVDGGGSVQWLIPDGDAASVVAPALRATGLEVVA